MTIDFGKVKFDIDENAIRAYAEIQDTASRLASRLADREELRLRAMFREAYDAGWDRGYDIADGVKPDTPDFDEWLDGFITKHQEG